MKQQLLIFPLLFIVILTCNKEPEEPKINYVKASGGLRMRSSPDLTAKKILTLSNNAEVLKLEVAGAEMTMAGKTGKWTKVSFQGQEGWVFGGFLSDSLPITNENCNKIQISWNEGQVANLFGEPDGKRTDTEPGEFGDIPKGGMVLIFQAIEPKACLVYFNNVKEVSARFWATYGTGF